MKQLIVNKKNLLKLLCNLRLEDKKELIFNFNKNYKQKFIRITLSTKEKYFFADDNGLPLAIGGAEEKIVDDLKIGQVWLISSKYFKKSNVKLIKFIKNKIEEYKNDFDILFNIIYKSNYSALNWLTRCGFRVKEIPHNKDYKLFYFTKGGINFDLRYIAC